MYIVDIKDQVKANNNFRKVLHTGTHSQIVAMCIAAGEDIGMETHETTDQMLFIVQGKGAAVLNGEKQSFDKHDVIFVPAGTEHNFINDGDEPLKLFTVYAPPDHPDGTVQATKADAEKEEGS